ncbi:MULTISPECIES: hypothetical protein [unclassified Variovorax]|uniref:hypothetical protein n=1 Tax=unclassified Variovorax TaxID=663243 RepID=UPI0008CBE800|nr:MULTISPECIES: hypothetical protein [unclassified Variovorax]SEK14923.1 hypothetical protein SAMN05518853_11611 [Variovorax sp. OK202]SFE06306.1 hypothetical protein SAMN05444746_11611 [Variovorax sp. OK212]
MVLRAHTGRSVTKATDARAPESEIEGQVDAASVLAAVLSGRDPLSASDATKLRLDLDASRRLSWREREAVRAQKEEDAARAFQVLKPGFSQMISHLLRSDVFAVGTASGEGSLRFPIYCHDSLDVQATGETVKYMGPRLDQFDKRVLLALLEQASGRQGDCECHFTAAEILEAMGRDLCSANVNRLRTSLTNLRAATITVALYERDSGYVFGLISDASWRGRKFSVRMDWRLAQALNTLGRTYIPMRQRRRLADGIQTALADLIYSTKVDLIQIRDLATMWGRDPEQLGRDITVALAKLVHAKVLQSYRRRRGFFTFTKGSREA